MQSEDPRATPDVVDLQEDLQALLDEGYRVVPALLSADELAALRAEIEAEMGEERFGRNDFEGRYTERLYGLAGRGPALDSLICHPRVLAVCEALLGEACLLSTAQAIRIHPGSAAQPLHFDDAFVHISRESRPTLNATAIFAIDEFDEWNGATVIVPGSHRWGDVWPEQASPQRSPGAPPVATRPAEAVSVCMPAGSLLLFVGTLWHGGGANRSGGPRLGVANQYCAPFLRPQETQLLQHPPERARALPPRLQRLVGYEIHEPFMGHVRGRHPRRLLEQS